MILSIVQEFRTHDDRIRSHVLAAFRHRQHQTGLPMTALQVCAAVLNANIGWSYPRVLAVVSSLVASEALLVANEGPIAWLALPCDQGRAFLEFERLTTRTYRQLWSELRGMGVPALDVFRVLGLPGTYRENLAEAIVARRFSPAWCW